MKEDQIRNQLQQIERQRSIAYFSLRTHREKVNGVYHFILNYEARKQDIVNVVLRKRVTLSKYNCILEKGSASKRYAVFMQDFLYGSKGYRILYGVDEAMRTMQTKLAELENEIIDIEGIVRQLDGQSSSLQWELQQV